MSANAVDIVFVGQSPIDIVANVDDSFLAKLGLQKSCSNLINKDQVTAIFEQLGTYSTHAGGAAANSAACYGALGGKVAFNGKMADDEMGHIFYDSFAPHHVHVARKPTPHIAGSDLIFVFVTTDKERTFAAYCGINDSISIDDLDLDIIKQAPMTFLEAYLMRANGGVQTLQDVGRIAKQARKKIAFSPSDIHIVQQYHDETFDLLKLTDIYVANMDETKALFKSDKSDDPYETLKQLQQHVECLVVTNGKDGAYIGTKDAIHHAPAGFLEQEQIVNTNGAGDHFAAGFLYGYLNGFDLKESGHFGNLYALEALQQESARPSRSHQDLLDHFTKQDK
jgi:sugar/nucleoside kinase (ribokinase family)